MNPRSVLRGAAVLLLVFLFVSEGCAQGGVVKEKLKFESTILHHDVRYSVYLPPDYETSNRWYPVVYLLHGFTGCEIDWVQYGEVDRLANDAVLQGIIPPMVIVMPDADSSWYINDAAGEQRYEDMMVKEFIPTVEKLYRVRASKEFRAIAGLSMGGFGTLMLAMRHPDLFSAAAGLSAAVVTDDELLERMKNDRWGFIGLFGKPVENQLPDWWKQYSVLNLASTIETRELTSVRWWLDCGDDDHLVRGNAMLNLILLDRKIPHEYRVRDGGHSWEYWRTGIIPALEFIGKGFTR